MTLIASPSLTFQFLSNALTQMVQRLEREHAWTHCQFEMTFDFDRMSFGLDFQAKTRDAGNKLHTVHNSYENLASLDDLDSTVTLRIGRGTSTIPNPVLLLFSNVKQHLNLEPHQLTLLLSHFLPYSTHFLLTSKAFLEVDGDLFQNADRNRRRFGQLQAAYELFEGSSWVNDAFSKAHLSGGAVVTRSHPLSRP